MENTSKVKRVWLGDVATGGGTYLDCINKVFEVTGKIPKNAFIDLQTNELCWSLGDEIKEEVLQSNNT